MVYISKKLPLASIAFAALLLAVVQTGCLSEKIEPVPAAQGGEAAFTVSVPGMKAPSTRSLDPAKEKEVTGFDVVIFGNAGNTVAEHHRIGASDIGSASGGNDYQFWVKGIENSENITVAVIANAPDEVSAALGAVYFGMAKKEFLLALHTSAAAKWDTSAGGYRTIPMYGEISVAGSIFGAATHTVHLTRMLAKVDVVNSIAPQGSPTDGDFELTAVHVVNRNSSGLIAPRWNTATGVLETPPATEANLPVGFAPGTVAWATDGDELTYTLSTGQTSLENEIYLFESAALSGNPATPDGLRLVFEGNYTSGGVTKRYYYPVDFTAPDGEYMPVLRNHRYLFTITEAGGRGYDRLGEAAAAFGVMSNLRTSLVVVDESGIRHIVWNGEYFLGVSEKAFTVAAAGQQNIELQISTNYADGWRASVEDAAANTWLTLTGGVAVVTGQITDKILTFDAAVLIGDEWAFNDGAILLTAGRLDMRIPVTQGEYKIVAEPGSAYVLDGVTQYSFKVKSNTQWAVRNVSDPATILLNSATQIADITANQSGGNNTSPGDDFTFTLIEDFASQMGKQFSVTFYDPTGRANDVTVNINTLSVYVIDQGNVHLYMWPYDQPTGYTWYDYANVPNGTLSTNLPPAGPQNAIPHPVSCAALPTSDPSKPWRLPVDIPNSQNEAAAQNSEARMMDYFFDSRPGARGYGHYGLVGGYPNMYWLALSASDTFAHHWDWSRDYLGHGYNSNAKGSTGMRARCVRTK